MRLRARRLAPGELDHELIWLSVSLVSLALAAAWLTVGLPWPRCVFHAITGLPCITCGMTRCGVQFFQGHFLSAIKWNPLVFAVLCGVVVFNLYAFVVLVTRAPRVRIAFGSSQTRFLRGAIVAALALNWFYSLWHWRDF
jgi:hypothetical protein